MPFVGRDLAAALSRVSDVSSTPEAGQHIGRAACHRTGDVTSRQDANWHKDEASNNSASIGDSSAFDASWQNKTGDGDRSNHPLKTGGRGTPMELFLAGLTDWDAELTQLMATVICGARSAKCTS